MAFWINLSALDMFKMQRQGCLMVESHGGELQVPPDLFLFLFLQLSKQFLEGHDTLFMNMHHVHVYSIAQ